MVSAPLSELTEKEGERKHFHGKQEHLHVQMTFFFKVQSNSITLEITLETQEILPKACSAT